MADLEAITELAKVIKKARLYDNGQFGKVLAVPVTEIAAVMEKLSKPHTKVEL